MTTPNHCAVDMRRKYVSVLTLRLDGKTGMQYIRILVLDCYGLVNAKNSWWWRKWY